MPRLAIIGLGKMGRTIEQLAPERGFEVVSRIDPRDGEAATVTRASLKGAQVAVEFSTPIARSISGDPVQAKGSPAG